MAMKIRLTLEILDGEGEVVSKETKGIVELMEELRRY